MLYEDFFERTQGQYHGLNEVIVVRFLNLGPSELNVFQLDLVHRLFEFLDISIYLLQIRCCFPEELKMSLVRNAGHSNDILTRSFSFPPPGGSAPPYLGWEEGFEMVKDVAIQF
jgi:hypothetical protein